MQGDERDAILQRLSSLTANNEKDVLDNLVQLSRVCVQASDNIKTDVRRERTELFEDVDPSGTTREYELVGPFI